MIGRRGIRAVGMMRDANDEELAEMLRPLQGEDAVLARPDGARLWRRPREAVDTF